MPLHAMPASAQP